MKKTAIGCLVVLVALMGSASGQEVDTEAILAKLTLEEKVGQMHMLGYTGRSLSPEMESLIEDKCICGFYFQPVSNFILPEQCARLMSSLQKRALKSRHGIPLLTSLDGEGGLAAPISFMMGATCTPGNMALGASGREEDAYAAYNALGRDLAACGINLDFAPEVDVLTNPANPDYTVRSFGADMSVNGRLARAAVKGLKDAGVIACAKHFPGLNCFVEDTHRDTPVVKMSKEEMWKGNMAHFRGAIGGGVDMIMTLHAVYEAYDPKHPATISQPIVTGMLRGDLGFKGVVIVDSISMGGISSRFSKEEAAVLAVKAGCDIVLQAPTDVNDLNARMNAVLDAVRKGDISEERINQSVRRILALKARYGLFKEPPTDFTDFESRIGRPEQVEANKKAALNAVVIVRDDQQILPLPKEGKKIAVICPPTFITRAGKNEKLPVGTTLGSAIRRYVPRVLEFRVDTVPGKHDLERVLKRLGSVDVVIATSLLAHQSPKQVEFIRKVLAAGKPTIVVGLGDPSDMALFPEVKTFVSECSPTPIGMEAVASVLFGEGKPGGRLPMPIGDIYPLGYAMKHPAYK